MTLTFLLASPWLLWLLFVFTMNWNDARKAGKLTWITWTLGGPFAAFGYAFDILFNIFIATVLLGELPTTWTLTKRLRKHFFEQTRRGDVARWIETDLCAPFTRSGKHIEP